MKKEGDSSFVLIQGNTDLMIADYSAEVYEHVKDRAPTMAEALKDDYFRINPVQREFLKNLPEKLDIELNVSSVQTDYEIKSYNKLKPTLPEAGSNEKIA